MARHIMKPLIFAFDDIYYIESDNGDISCTAKNADGFLVRRIIGSGDFSVIHGYFPWAYKIGTKGVLVNFNNVERFNGLIREKDSVTLNLVAPDGGVLNGFY